MTNLLHTTLLTFLMVAAVFANTPSQEGCTGYQGDQYCTSCDSSKMYYLIGNGCVRYSGNACTAIDYQGNCINCQQGFYLAYGNTCTLVNFIVGCTDYATDTSVTICRKCAPNYILERNRCLESVPNCLQYIVGTNICAKCALGYTQAPDWCSCVPGTIQHCIQYDCLGMCVQCSANFPRLSVQRNLCLTWIPYCQVYVSNANGCRVCYPGYVVSSDGLECFPGIRWCKEHALTFSGSVLTCNVCNTDYYLSADKKSCNSEIPNCNIINTNTHTCQQCVPGYIQTDDNKACLPIIANCFIYQQSNHLSTQHKCAECVGGYIVDENHLHCEIICQNGFSACPATNTCVEIPKCCEFHDFCGHCLSLKAGWLWCDSHCCVEIPKHCQTYDPCGNCICPEGQSWCAEKKQCVITPDCCATHDGCGNCKSLKPGYTFCAVDQRCYRIPLNCQLYDDCGNCKCGNGFTVCPATGACIAEPICCIGSNDLCGNCLTVNRPWVWCRNTKECRQINADCPDYDDGCGNCVCPFGLEWCQAQKKCVTRVLCPQNSVYDGCGSCICNGVNTVYCANSNSCVTVLSCWATPYNCDAPVILPGFAICAQTGNCYQIPNCPGNQENCGTCLCAQNQKYCARLNQCVSTPSCCASDDGCGSCTSTFVGTVFINGQCFNQVNIPFCQIYTANLQNCVQCVQGYLVNSAGTQCLPDILKCQTYVPLAPGDAFRKCANCESPYFPSADQRQCVVLRCLTEVRTANSITCSLCQGQLILNNENNICAERIQFCIQYNIAVIGGQVFTSCNACSVPYFVDKGICKNFGFRILGYSASGNYALGGGSSFFVSDFSNVQLQWSLYSSAFTSSSWISIFELSPIEGTTDRFSIRIFKQVQSNINVPYSITRSGNNIGMATYKPNGNVADDTQQWFVEFNVVEKSYTIRSRSDNLYISDSLSLRGQPFKFHFDIVL